MKDPTYDKNGYPTEGTLETIEKWPETDLQGLIEFAEEAWHTDYGKLVLEAGTGRRSFITGGWSGNEDIIGAMRKNVVFRSLCWQKSERGGLHVFRVPENLK